jgi:uncharacterized coiled-coil protein SlyX
MPDFTPSYVRVATAAVAAACMASGCSLPPSLAPSSPPPAAETANDLEPALPRPAPDPALERRVASLELQLLERAAQVEELEGQLDEARREVVRSMARLQSIATRAEAASGIAEAELAVESLPATAAGATADIRRLTELSSAEFEKSNYGGALYLANQAKSAALSARGQLAEVEIGPLKPFERSLALPLELQTTTGTNVRSGPGTTFDVLFTLPAQSPVVAYSSAEQWLRIVDDAGRRGWISQTLIRGRP